MTALDRMLCAVQNQLAEPGTSHMNPVQTTEPVHLQQPARLGLCAGASKTFHARQNPDRHIRNGLRPGVHFEPQQVADDIGSVPSAIPSPDATTGNIPPDLCQGG